MPPRLRAFFFNREPELLFHSEATKEELMDRLRVELRPRFFQGHRAMGRMTGPRFRMVWATGFFRDSFAPVFYGCVEDARDGAAISGRMSHDPFTRVFFGLWCGLIVLVSLAFVWTIMMPLVGYGMLWLANGMIAIGDGLYPERRQNIRNFIREVCDSETPFS